MVFVTADTHGELDRLTGKGVKHIKKYDTVIVLGDFGFIWQNQKDTEKALKKLAKMPFNTLFIDGWYENFSALENYPDTVYKGAAAKEIIPGKIYYIKRGGILDIEDFKILCFGGADDYIDDMFCDRPPCQEDFDRCDANLEKAGYKVDYILTHSPSGKMNRFLNLDSYTTGALFDYLDTVSDRVEYKKWYFGFYHKDKYISSKAMAVYDGIYKLGE